MRRFFGGALVALAGIAVLSGAMIPLRDHLSVATPALVLVVPVVAGVAAGGLWAGVLAVVLGFVAYDFFFIPPYYTLSVGTAQNWVALGVYVVVMLVVAALVVSLQRARAESWRRERDTRHLYDLSDLLIGDKQLSELLQLIVSTIHQAFNARWVAVLLPSVRGQGAGDASLAVAATAGEELSADELRSLSPEPGRTANLRTGGGRAGSGRTGGGRAGGRRAGGPGIEHGESGQSGETGEEVIQVALTARGRPVGLVAMAGPPLDHHDAELLHVYGNQAALALERSQLREQALRTKLLEEVGQWREALMGAVSHDLRTPLASVKAAVTTLRRPAPILSEGNRAELLELIETQSDALDRLVENLLDMSRIQAGALRLRREISPVSDIVEGALRVLGRVDVDVVVTLAADLPPVDVDQILMEQVLANLVDNAIRHSPGAGPVEVSATIAGGLVELEVRDHGPGVPGTERDQVFQMFNRVSGGGRAGLGLAIAKAFVEAHGQTIRVEDPPGGGARFVFTMAAAHFSDHASVAKSVTCGDVVSFVGGAGNPHGAC